MGTVLKFPNKKKSREKYKSQAEIIYSVIANCERIIYDPQPHHNLTPQEYRDKAIDFIINDLELAYLHGRLKEIDSNEKHFK